VSRRPAGSVTLASMRSRMMAVALAALLLAVGGCGDDDDGSGADPGPPTAADLDGRTFVSTAAEGFTLVPGTQVTLTFEDGNLSATAGCNTMSAPYEIDDGTLEVEQMSTTLIGCPDDLQRQDQTVQDLLTGGPGVILDVDVLTISGQGITLTAREQT
jgi:heat shock protein HslJ